MKRIVCILLSLLTCCAFFFGATACSCLDYIKENNGEQEEENGEGGDETNSEEPDNGDTTPVTWTITYQAAPISAIDEIVFNAIKKKIGNYPESYVEGVGVTVDGLRSDVVDQDYLYTFIGWYYDEDCVQACENGVIPVDKSGDITLYAKVQKTPRAELDDEDWGS